MSRDEEKRREFLENVRVLPNKCWKWVGEMHQSGRYGQCTYNGKAVSAQKLSYILFVGSVPEGLLVHQICGCKECIKPEHQLLMTREELQKEGSKSMVWHGDKNGGAKLTEQQVWEIKLLRERGMKVTELIERFNVSKRLIYYIVNGESWPHIKLTPELRGALKSVLS